MSTGAQNREFLEGIFELGSPFITRRLQRLPERAATGVRRFALHVLEDSNLKRHEKLRNGAVRLIVALLPETFSVIKKLLADRWSPLWYEVQFTIFCALDRDDLKPADRARVLELVHDYLHGISSDAGAAAWKAGDLLGDEWRDSETLRMLEQLLFSARYAAGRKAALHGIEHALNEATPAERDRLFALVQRVAEEDRSAEVRRGAQQALEGVGCGPLSPSKSGGGSSGAG